MSDLSIDGQASAQGIDSRILAHLLTEAIDLLEEAQFHAAIEDHDEASNRVLANAISQIAGICAWLTEQMSAERKAGEPSRIQMNIRPADPTVPGISDSLRSLYMQAERLHERACKLDNLVHDEDAQAEALVGPRPSAEIIAFPGASAPQDKHEENAVLNSQAHLSGVFEKS